MIRQNIVRLRKERLPRVFGTSFLIKETLVCRRCTRNFPSHFGRRVYLLNKIEEFCSKRCRVFHYR